LEVEDPDWSLFVEELLPDWLSVLLLLTCPLAVSVAADKSNTGRVLLSTGVGGSLGIPSKLFMELGSMTFLMLLKLPKTSCMFLSSLSVFTGSENRGPSQGFRGLVMMLSI
jgi:hypothetical protein